MGRNGKGKCSQMPRFEWGGFEFWVWMMERRCSTEPLAVYCHLNSVYSVNYLHACVLCFVCWWPCYLLIVGILEQPNLKISSVNQILLLDHDYGTRIASMKLKTPMGWGNLQRHEETVYMYIQCPGNYSDYPVIFCFGFGCCFGFFNYFFEAVDRRLQIDQHCSVAAALFIKGTNFKQSLFLVSQIFNGSSLVRPGFGVRRRESWSGFFWRN